MSDDFHPEFLYRFRPYTEDKHKAWVREIIVENKIYAASPSTFNDPFDCKINFDVSASEEEIVNFSSKLLQKFHPHLSPDQMQEEAREMARSGHWKLIAPDFLSPVVKSMGVISFSSILDDMLMWSHYAESHRGIALQFSAGTIDQVFTASYPVDYRSQYPSIRLVDYGGREQLLQILLVKSVDWRYEHEYRHITFEKGFGYVEFNPELLTGIIFGCEMPDKEKQEIIAMVAARPLKPTLYQARKAEGCFGLIIEEITLE